MAEDIASLGFSVDTSELQKGADALEKVEKNADEAGKSAKNLSGSIDSAASSASKMLGPLASVAALLGAAFSVSAIIKAADTFSDLNARVALAVGGVDKGAAAMERLSDIASNTYSSMALTTESFITNAKVLRELGKSTMETLDYTEALNNALVVSGAKGERAASVQNALGKAMALGKLSGDELNTVIASGGRVTEALAAQMGVTTLELRKLGTDGKITGDIIFDALSSRMIELREEAAGMPATMGDAATAVGNAFLMIVGAVDTATGATGTLAQMIKNAADWLASYAGTIAQAFVFVQNIISGLIDYISPLFSGIEMGGAGAVAGIGLLAAAFTGVAAVIYSAVIPAITSMTMALLANPIGLIVGAIAAAVAALFIFRDAIASVLGFDLIDAIKTGANYFIGAYIGAFNAIKVIWNNLPAVFEFAVKTSVNSVIYALIWMVEKTSEIFSAIPGLLKSAWDNFPAILYNAMVSAAKLIMDAISWLINSTVDMLNDMLAGVRWLLDKAGVGFEAISNVDLSGGLKEMEASADATKVAVDFLKGGLLEMSEEAGGMGSKISAAFSEGMSTDYIGNMTEALGGLWKGAEQVKKGADEMNAALSGDAGPGGATGAAEEEGKKNRGRGGKTPAEKLRDEMDKRLEVLRESFASEEQLRQEQYLKDIETLNYARENEMLSQAEYNAYKLATEEKYQNDLMRIRGKQFAGALDATADFFGELSALQDGGNASMLKAQKIFAAASALVNAYLAASQVLADPTVPFLGKFAAVAAVIAKGIALVGAIRSGGSSGGGGGGGGGGAGTSASAAPPPREERQQAVQIALHGEMFSKQSVADLMEKMNENIKDGFKLNIVTT